MPCDEPGRAAPRSPLVVLTGLDDESLAAQSLHEGAQDYLIKGQIETRGLLRSLRYAIERNLMDEALTAEKDRAQVTLNCIGDAVVCTDMRGKITFLNMVAEKMTGWSMIEAEGRPLTDVSERSPPWAAARAKPRRNWRFCRFAPCICRRVAH